MSTDRILQAAKAATPKHSLEPHKEAIKILREKGYTWRECASFLSEQGVETTHTKLFRFMKNNASVTVPSADAYAQQLDSIDISKEQLAMLKAHYNAHNRSITFTELAEAAGYESYKIANRWYGQLGRDLGEALGFEFPPSAKNPEKPFYSSSIGMPDHYAEGDFKLVMHHELAKAIQAMGLAE